MILDSLGELHMLRGEMDEAKDYLTRAVALATENGNKWYAGQALRTLGRCYLAISNPGMALEKANEALNLAENIGDRQAICETQLPPAVTIAPGHEAHCWTAAPGDPARHPIETVGGYGGGAALAPPHST